MMVSVIVHFEWVSLPAANDFCIPCWRRGWLVTVGLRVSKLISLALARADIVDVKLLLGRVKTTRGRKKKAFRRYMQGEVRERAR